MHWPPQSSTGGSKDVTVVKYPTLHEALHYFLLLYLEFVVVFSFPVMVQTDRSDWLEPQNS